MKPKIFVILFFLLILINITEFSDENNLIILEKNKFIRCTQIEMSDDMIYKKINVFFTSEITNDIGNRGKLLMLTDLH